MKSLSTVVLATVVTVGLLFTTSGSALAQDYPPSFSHKFWLDTGASMEGKDASVPSVHAGSSAWKYILWDKDALQLRHAVYKGIGNDPANLIIQTGDFTPDEPEYEAFRQKTQRSQGECKVKRVNEMYWELNRCTWTTMPCKKTGSGGVCPNDPAGTTPPEAGDYTSVVYWRTKGGEPWKPMHVNHLKLDEIGSGTGRFKQKGWFHVGTHFAQMAAINISPKDQRVYAEWYDSGGPEKNWGDCKQFVGLFTDKGDLVALGTSAGGDTDCWSRYTHYKEKKGSHMAHGGRSTQLQRPDGRGSMDRRAEFKADDLLGKDAKYKLVVVTGDWRREWDFEVKGGRVQTHERQREDFTPTHYQWVEPNENPALGRQWLPSKAHETQPITVK